MGSKSRIAKDILRIILKDYTPDKWYVEPFAGGMNTIDKFSVDGRIIANDSNLYLIEMWRCILNGWIPEKVDREMYNDIRDNKEKYPPNLVGWVGFNCSYSGKYFGGFAGETKTKINTVRDYQKEAIKNVLKQASKMKNVILTNTDYLLLDIPFKSIVYCDPPYEGTTEYKDKFNHNTFWDWVRQISKSHQVFISEYKAPPDFKCIWSKKVNSSLSANGKVGSNKESIEKLFTI